MKLPPAIIHPEGESKSEESKELTTRQEVDTYAGKLQMEWDPDAEVTPLGQLPYFIQFLKVGERFNPWVEDCPLHYASNNAPTKTDVLGSFLLSILSGHKRYSHIGMLAADKVSPGLLGMKKVVSDDSARRGLKRIEEEAGVSWLQKHLQSCYEPLLRTDWILDIDTTIKPLYGHQEGAEVGYNPHKPGRPSHSYHSYLIANLRLVLDVEVQAGNETRSTHSLPGLIALLDRLPDGCSPTFIRGDCDFGNDTVMRALEEKNYEYLFKLRKSNNVKKLIYKHHGEGDWIFFKDGWEAKDADLQLHGWKQERRVVIVRRRIGSKSSMLAVDHQQAGQRQLSFVEGPENLKLYDYAVLVTNLELEVISLVQHYRDRADCENVFDETKNQWGWGGFATHDLKSCRFMARIIALIYNWWTLFVRLANPDSHLEAITSRPLLLTSVGRMTRSGRQKKLIITSNHAQRSVIVKASNRITSFFNHLKASAPQLSSAQRWQRILVKALEKFQLNIGTGPPELLASPV